MINQQLWTEHVYTPMLLNQSWGKNLAKNKRMKNSQYFLNQKKIFTNLWNKLLSDQRNATLCVMTFCTYLLTYLLSDTKANGFKAKIRYWHIKINRVIYKHSDWLFKLLFLAFQYHILLLLLFYLTLLLIIVCFCSAFCHSTCFLMTLINQQLLVKNFSRYDTRKYVFTQRIINIWNSLPVHFVNSSSVNSLKNNLDRFWSNQEVYYNFRCDITGPGNRSLSQNWLEIVLKYVIKRWT